MSLTLALNNALSGLRVNERQLATLSQNISNANTEGYTRKIVDQEAQYIDGQGGAGVLVSDISRRVDTYLQRSIIEQQGEVGRVNVLDDYSERLQILFGQPGQDNTIDEYTEDFFSNIQALSEAPELTSLQTSAVNSGIILANEVSRLATEIEELRFQADQDITILIDNVNEIIQQLEVTNLAINRAAALNTDITGLLDERDNLLNELSTYVDVEYFFEETGEVSVYLRGGTSLLDDELYQLTYSPAATLQQFVENDPPFTEIQVVRVEFDGSLDTDRARTIVTGGVGDEVQAVFQTGELKGLLELRDVELPAILEQLDEFAATLRDLFNGIHNDGSGYPGAFELVGTRQVNANDEFDWVGGVTIAVTDVDGRAPLSPYADETHTGIRPLNLNLGELDALQGEGPGRPTVQSIIDEINNALQPLPPKTTLNNMNNIQIASLSNQLPAGGGFFEFNFDLANISDQQSDFYFLDVRVFDDAAVDITGANTITTPRVDIDAAATFTTFAGLPDVRVQTVGAHNYEVGDVVFIPNTGVPAVVDGIPQANITGFVTITAVTGSTFTFDAGVNALAGGAVGVAGLQSTSTYEEVQPGEQTRSTNGSIQASVTGNLASAFYDIQVDVAVRNIDPDDPNNNTIETTTLTYRVPNNTENLENDRFNTLSVDAGTATIVAANNSQPYARAYLADADGNELPNEDGFYGSQQGFLVIEGNEEAGYYVHIDENSSQQQGNSADGDDGTNRGFSHFFELNNFFVSNNSTNTGDTLKNSAINLAVADRFFEDPTLFSTGDLEMAVQPLDPAEPPVFALERNVGDNSVANRLFQLNVDRQTFDAAGGLSATATTFGAYTGEILAFSASNAATLSRESEDQNLLLEGFTQRNSALSGVNLDEELANTILYQNAYTANARVITVTDELFDALLSAV